MLGEALWFTDTSRVSELYHPIKPVGRPSPVASRPRSVDYLPACACSCHPQRRWPCDPSHRRRLDFDPLLATPSTCTLVGTTADQVEFDARCKAVVTEDRRLPPTISWMTPGLGTSFFMCPLKRLSVRPSTTRRCVQRLVKADAN